MESIKISTSVELIAVECGGCGAVFAMSKKKYNRCQETGEEWHCPNGCCRVFSETKLMKLKHRLDQTEAELERQRERTDGALRQLAAQKGHNTRLRKRIQAGVCPECHRHFENLQRHMETKHS